jgi:predicted ArsR family transcriptional regulator
MVIDATLSATMNPKVFLLFLAAALACGALLDRKDRAVRRQMSDLATNGMVETATAIVTQVRNGRDQLLLKLHDGSRIGVRLGDLPRPRPETAMQVRVVRDPSTQRARAAELVNAPLRSMGRALTISVALSIVVLGAVFALLS